MRKSGSSKPYSSSPDGGEKTVLLFWGDISDPHPPHHLSLPSNPSQTERQRAVLSPGGEKTECTDFNSGRVSGRWGGGGCNEALDQARKEGRREMARRNGRTCSGRTIPLVWSPRDMAEPNCCISRPPASQNAPCQHLACRLAPIFSLLHAFYQRSCCH